MSLDFLYIAISWVLLRWHQLWGLAFGAKTDLSWVLAIIFLVITIRLVLFPLFVKQIHSQRKMQELQPKLKELQAKHKGDKETLQREMMALYKENGANPIAGCLPIFLQAPVFLSLYHVLKRLDPTRHRDEAAKQLYGWTAQEFDSAAHAKIFGAPISAHLSSSAATLQQLGASVIAVRVVGVVLIAIMVLTTYITQRQILAKQSASGAPVDPQQQMIQRLMLYGIPASLLVSGSLFPLGVVLYWCTTNVWSMGQQFYVLRRMPPPGTVTTAATSTDAKRPAVDARALVPKPGARPQVPKQVAKKPSTQVGAPESAPTTAVAATATSLKGANAAAAEADGGKAARANGATPDSATADGVHDPAKADPAKADPAKADPAKADPAKADPAKANPAKASGRTPANRPKSRKGGRR